LWYCADTDYIALFLTAERQATTSWVRPTQIVNAKTLIKFVHQKLTMARCLT